MAGRAPLAFVCDFDGTAVLLDIGDEICRRFAPSAWDEFDRRLRAGELSLPEAQLRVWPLVRASEEAVLAYVDEIARFRDGFERFCGEAVARGVRVLVASGGLDFYVRRVLTRLGPLSPSIEVIANLGRFRGGSIEVEFPHRYSLGCTRWGCAVCKGRVLRRLAEDGFETLFAGDGRSDRCAAGIAGRLFAVEDSPLARYCRAQGIACTSFRSFGELVPALCDATG